MRKEKRAFFYVFLFVMIACLTGCGRKNDVQEAPELLPAAGVARDVATVVRMDHSTPKLYEAFTACHVEELSFNVNGVIDQVNVLPGDFVHKGDRLVTLNLDAERKQAESLKESIARTEAANAYANRLTEVDIQILEIEKQSLIASGASDDEIRLKDLDIRQKKTDLAQSIEVQNMNLLKTRSELERLEGILKNDAIVAPFDGYVARGIQVGKGSGIKAYDTVVLLADHSRVKLMCDAVSEITLRSATGGYYALINGNRYDLEYIVMDKDEFAAKSLVGDIVYAEFNITGPEGWEKKIEPGLYAGLMLINNYLPDQLLIPQNAVLTGADGKYVYVVGENGESVKRMIKIRNYQDSVYSVVLEGLEEGEKIYVTDK